MYMSLDVLMNVTLAAIVQPLSISFYESNTILFILVTNLKLFHFVSLFMNNVLQAILSFNKALTRT